MPAVPTTERRVKFRGLAYAGGAGRSVLREWENQLEPSLFYDLSLCVCELATNRVHDWDDAGGDEAELAVWRSEALVRAEIRGHHAHVVMTEPLAIARSDGECSSSTGSPIGGGSIRARERSYGARSTSPRTVARERPPAERRPRARFSPGCLRESARRALSALRRRSTAAPHCGRERAAFSRRPRRTVARLSERSPSCGQPAWWSARCAAARAPRTPARTA